MPFPTVRQPTSNLRSFENPQKRQRHNNDGNSDSESDGSDGDDHDLFDKKKEDVAPEVEEENKEE
jgi:hypothetical protein